MSVTTLERWRAQALSSPGHGRGWTAASRLEALIATAALDEVGRSAWCREKGVFPADLEAWRADAMAGLGAPRPDGSTTARLDAKRTRELERELRRKDKALAEAAQPGGGGLRQAPGAHPHAGGLGRRVGQCCEDVVVYLDLHPVFQSTI